MVASLDCGVTRSEIGRELREYNRDRGCSSWELSGKMGQWHFSRGLVTRIGLVRLAHKHSENA